MMSLIRKSVSMRGFCEAAKAAAASIPKPGEPTLFDKLVSRELPCDVVYEDEVSFAFRDISPQAPTHIVLIPKERGTLTGID
jgi:histidine triad (HIT) family protein